MTVGPIREPTAGNLTNGAVPTLAFILARAVAFPAAWPCRNLIFSVAPETSVENAELFSFDRMLIATVYSRVYHSDGGPGWLSAGGCDYGTYVF
jgi:hypothetical protein